MRCIRTHCTEQATAHQVSQLGIADAAAILSKGQAQAKVRTAEADVILAKAEAGAKVVIAEAAAVLAKGEAEAKVWKTHSRILHEERGNRRAGRPVELGLPVQITLDVKYDSCLFAHMLFYPLAGGLYACHVGRNNT